MDQKIAGPGSWDSVMLNHIKKYILGSGQTVFDNIAILILELGLRECPINWFEDSEVIEAGLFKAGTIRGRKALLCKIPPGTFMLEAVLHVANSLNVKYILALGSAGGTQEDLKSGDYIVPVHAYKGEGTSCYYLKKHENPEPGTHILGKLESILKAKGKKYLKGSVYTTASIFMETEKFIHSLKKNGFLGIDCETSALFAVAAYLGQEAINTLVVGDLPVKGYMGDGIHMPNSDFRESLLGIKDLYCALIEALN